MHKTVVINVVGLVPSLVGESTPRIRDFLDRGKASEVDPVIPAVTATGHATYLTGKLPREHGVVGNAAARCRTRSAPARAFGAAP